jgi:serine/threonine-protein kinase
LSAAASARPARACGSRRQLIDTASRCYLWSESIDADTTDLFDAQERVAHAIVRRLEPEFAEGPRPSGRRPTQNLAAHNLYLQGRYHLSQRSEEGLLKALEFFERALVEDAQYAPAHSGLADAYGLCNHYGVMGPSEVWTKAASSAATAVMLDDHSGEAHTSLAHVKATQDWDWLGSEREFRRAISLNPRNATAHHWYAASCSRRWDGSTRRWMKCSWRSRSTRCRRSWRATSPRCTSTGATSRPRSSAAITPSS